MSGLGAGVDFFYLSLTLFDKAQVVLKKLRGRALSFQGRFDVWDLVPKLFLQPRDTVRR